MVIMMLTMVITAPMMAIGGVISPCRRTPSWRGC
jgi:hypothetical protein